MVTLPSIFVHPLMTCLYGILGSYAVARWQMKKQAQANNNIKILHEVQGPIDIGSGLTSLFPNVKLRYNGEYINFKIQYITGIIKNTDKKKTVTTLKLPFELILPENCKVLEAKILKSPKEEIQAKNKGKTVEIPMPETFLPQEQIKYCILYKSPDKVESKINLKTRIADVDVISTEDNYVNFDKVINAGISVLVCLIFMFIAIYFMSLNDILKDTLDPVIKISQIFLAAVAFATTVVLFISHNLSHTKH